ncbi:ATP-binding protein [Bifidobacterium apri]|nr:ATP-binding protein [Bifidobacterium apri]
MTSVSNAPRQPEVPPATRPTSAQPYGAQLYGAQPYGGVAPLAPAKLPLLRPTYGRMLCGVCRGISLHLGVSVWLVRLVFILTSFVFGAGIIAYIFLWLTIPVGDPRLEAQRLRPVHQVPLARGNVPYPTQPATPPAFYRQAAVPWAGGAAGQAGIAELATPARGTSTSTSTSTSTAIPQGAAASPSLRSPTAANTNNAATTGTETSGESLMDAIRRAPKPAIIALAGIIMLVISIIMLRTGETTMLLPAMMTVGGVLIAWLRFNEQGSQWPTAILGLVILVAAYCLAILLQPDAPNPRGTIMLAGVALLVAAALAVIPWIMSLTSSLSTERALKEREEERADMTAHLHDGVLQTLALIQLHSDEPQTVLALARQQERELRNWLYQERTPPDTSVSTGIKDIAAEVEDESGKAIEVVTVGDAQPCTQTDALLNATRQALINAVTHGGEPISVYCEAGTTTVDVYVRDHGEGFDVDAIPEGRLGIRESIIGRIKRRGGTVHIVSRPHWGTEVRMHMPIGGTSNTANAHTHMMDSAGNDQHRADQLSADQHRASGIEEQ